MSKPLSASRIDLPTPDVVTADTMPVGEFSEILASVVDMGRKENAKVELFANVLDEYPVADGYVFLRQFADRFAHPEWTLGVGEATMNEAAAKSFFDGDIDRVRDARDNHGSLSAALYARDAEKMVSELSDVRVIYTMEDIRDLQRDVATTDVTGEQVQHIAAAMQGCENPWVVAYCLGDDMALYVGHSLLGDTVEQVVDSVERAGFGPVADMPTVYLDAVSDDRTYRGECYPHGPVAEMKAKSADAERAAELAAADDEDWVAQTKYDGARVCIHHAGDGDYRAYVSGGRDVTAALPELFEPPMSEELPEFECVLDAEVTPYDPETGEVLPFQHILRRTGLSADGVYDPPERDVEARFKLFDVLHWHGHDVSDDPYRERLAILRAAFSPEVVAWTGTDFQTVFDRSVAAGHEGVMLKDLTRPYIFNVRSSRMLKWKAEPMECDCRILDAVEGGGKFAGGVGALSVGVEASDGSWVCVGAVGTGFSDETRERLLEMHEAGDLVGRTLQVGFEDVQVTDDGASLRFPRYEGLRPEGSPDSVTRLAELADVPASVLG